LERGGVHWQHGRRSSALDACQTCPPPIHSASPSLPLSSPLLFFLLSPFLLSRSHRGCPTAHTWSSSPYFWSSSHCIALHTLELFTPWSSETERAWHQGMAPACRRSSSVWGVRLHTHTHRHACTPGKAAGGERVASHDPRRHANVHTSECHCGPTRVLMCVRFCVPWPVACHGLHPGPGRRVCAWY
jgi:hypothetical protein